MLEEYYAIDEVASRGADGAWSASPAHVPPIASLRIAATDLRPTHPARGRASPIELWQLVDDANPTVIIGLDRSPARPRNATPRSTSRRSSPSTRPNGRKARALSGRSLLAVQAIGVALSLLALWWVFQPIAKQLYLPLFLALALPMTFLVYRGWGRSDRARDEEHADNPGLVDWGLALVSVIPLAYIALDWQNFFRRAARPTELDISSWPRSWPW